MAGGPGDTRSRRDVIVVFAKAPRAGMVKTRLCPPLDAEQAAELYGHLLDDVLELTAGFAEVADLDAVLAVHPPASREELALRAPRCFRVIAQRGRGLAERMAHAVAEAAAAGARKILIRGSDNPALPCEGLRAALVALDRVDVAISPDLDGGYGLIAVRGSWPLLFDHPMSTRTVLDETLASARTLGLRTITLASSFDIDRADDLVRLLRAYESQPLDGCERTVGWIRRHRAMILH